MEAAEGEVLLKACLEHGVYIPNLCYLEEMISPPASCRLCFVEVKGTSDPVPACTQTVYDGMVVKTSTPAVRSLQRAGLQLLLSAHDVNCGECPANKKCDLQAIARFLKVGLKPKRLERFVKEWPAEDEHPYLMFYPERCVLCGRCVHVCRDKHGRPYLTFARRGFDTVISFYGEREMELPACGKELACVEICPVAAILPKDGGDC